jgi:hypothetical protein
MSEQRSPEGCWVLRNKGGRYFCEWTGIGPRFTHDISKAARFESERSALLESGRHYGFVGCEPVPEVEAEVERG